ncbi:MAG: hypothetical protein VX777_09065 [Chlamydiota bacterium]|nr:hypothetical protein [Chlamydiota bacterium]
MNPTHKLHLFTNTRTPEEQRNQTSLNQVPLQLEKKELTQSNQTSAKITAIQDNAIIRLNESTISQLENTYTLPKVFQGVIKQSCNPKVDLIQGLFIDTLNITYDIKDNLSKGPKDPENMKLLEILSKTLILCISMLDKLVLKPVPEEGKKNKLFALFNRLIPDLTNCINVNRTHFNDTNNHELNKFKVIAEQLLLTVKNEGVPHEIYRRKLTDCVTSKQIITQETIEENFDKTMTSILSMKKSFSCFFEFYYSKALENMFTNLYATSQKAPKTSVQKELTGIIENILKMAKAQIVQSKNKNYDHRPIQNLLNFIIAYHNPLIQFMIIKISNSNRSELLRTVKSTEREGAPQLLRMINLPFYTKNYIYDPVENTLQNCFNSYLDQVAHTFSLTTEFNGKVLNIEAAKNLTQSLSVLKKELDIYYTLTIEKLPEALSGIFKYTEVLKKYIEDYEENQVPTGKFFLAARQLTFLLETVEKKGLNETLKNPKLLRKIFYNTTSEKKRNHISQKRIQGLMNLLQLFEDYARPIIKNVQNFDENFLIVKEKVSPEAVELIEESIEDTTVPKEPINEKDIDTKREAPETHVVNTVTYSDLQLDDSEMNEINENLSNKERLKKIEEKITEIGTCSINQTDSKRNMKLRTLLQIIREHGYKVDKRRGKGSHIQATKPGCPTLTLTGHKMVSPGVTEQNLKALEEAESTQDKPTNDVKQVDSSKELRTKNQQKKKKTKKNRPKRR